MTRRKDTLRHIAPAHGSVLLFALALAGSVSGQTTPALSVLPATAPTTAVSPSQMPSANPGIPLTAAGKLSVSWDGAQIQIRADNVGLNTLLHDIAGKTGLKITGGAPDERIFGTYGPGKLDDVLSDLLNGVAVNVLFLDRSGTARKELVLTARGGEATPPSAAPQEAASEAPQQEPVRDGGRGQGFTGQGRPYPRRGQPADQGGTSPASPDGTKTPQEIFEQLQRLRSQAGRQ